MLELDRTRKGLVSHLADVAAEARRILVHGPWGIGKTTLLVEVARAAQNAGVRVAYRAQTESLGDVVATIEEAYGGPEHMEGTARHRKSRSRLVCETERGLILLDGFRAGGTALVGFLRSLRGKQLAVIAAVDVEHPRDLAAARAAGVAYHEIAVPPLASRSLGRYLDQLLATAPPPFDLTTAGRRAVLRLARGCPGVLERAWARLQEPRYWRDGAPLIETIGADIRVQRLAARRIAASREEMPN